MGRPKLDLELAPGRPLGSYALSAMLACPALDKIVAVVRPDDPLIWASGADAKAEAATGRLRFAACPDAADGMSRSVRRGLAEALAGAPDDAPAAVAVVLADQPFVTAALLTRLAAACAADPALDFAACRRGGIAHPPVLLGRSMFTAAAALEGDAGARKLLADPARRGALVDADSDAAFTDVDTVSDWEATVTRKLN